jgi:hypothetical protein
MMGFHSVGSRSDLESCRSEGILPRRGRETGMGLEGDDVIDDVEEEDSMLMGEEEGEVIVYVYEEAERGLQESLRRQL